MVMAAQHSFNFAQLHTETAQLHLVVGASMVLIASVRPFDRQITCAVDKFSRNLRKRVGMEGFAGFFRVVQIPFGQLNAADPQLAKFTHGHFMHVLIQIFDIHAGNRLADGNAHLPC
ncbi:hypothetical protein D3C73_1132720 [compost metagenome]